MMSAAHEQQYAPASAARSQFLLHIGLAMAQAIEERVEDSTIPFRFFPAPFRFFPAQWASVSNSPASGRRFPGNGASSALATGPGKTGVLG